MSALSACPPSCTRERAVYHCNSAACHVKLKRFALGKEHCDKALVLKQDYVKALMRRILCLEMMDDEETLVVVELDRVKIFKLYYTYISRCTSPAEP